MKIFVIVALTLIVIMQAIQTEVARETHNALGRQQYSECLSNPYMPKPCDYTKW